MSRSYEQDAFDVKVGDVSNIVFNLSSHEKNKKRDNEHRWKKQTTPVRFELTRENPIGLVIQRLNRSAMASGHFFTLTYFNSKTFSSTCCKTLCLEYLSRWKKSKLGAAPCAKNFYKLINKSIIQIENTVSQHAGWTDASLAVLRSFTLRAFLTMFSLWGPNNIS